MKDALFKKSFNKKLLRKLARSYGPLLYHHLKFKVSTEVMRRMMDKMENKPRRGEVVMVIPDADGRIWLHTKDFYPQGVYRLMTGGLEPGEVPREALTREVKEETGFEVKIERCLAVVTYRLSDDSVKLPFVSYIFLTTPGSGAPAPKDTGEGITGFKAVSREGLFETAEALKNLDGDFADWGRFRAVAHELVGRLLG